MVCAAVKDLVQIRLLVFYQGHCQPLDFLVDILEDATVLGIASCCRYRLVLYEHLHLVEIAIAELALPVPFAHALGLIDLVIDSNWLHLFERIAG